MILSTALFGVLCLGLRIWMLRTGIDEKGLLVRGNLLNIAMWIITAVYLAALFVLTGKLGRSGNYRLNFPQSGICGWLAMAGGLIMVSVVFDGALPQRVLAGAAVVCMVISGWCRFARLRPSFLFHAVVCVFFLVSLIGKYRGWSSDTQIHEYGFQMLACVALVLYSSHRCSADVNPIQRRQMVFTGLAACFFCITALSDSTAPGFYAGALLWTAGSLCTLKTLPTDQPKPSEKKEN